jgi:hypothetical protein
VGVDAGAYARQLMGAARDVADDVTQPLASDYQATSVSILAAKAAVVSELERRYVTQAGGVSSDGTSGSREDVGAGAGSVSGAIIDLSVASKALPLQQLILERAYYKTDVRGE